MKMHGHILHPTHCFCQVPDADLRPWVEKRYIECCSTLELMNSTDDPYKQELISIVALLDVDDDTLLEMMGDVHLPHHHILHCRENARRLLGLLDR